MLFTGGRCFRALLRFSRGLDSPTGLPVGSRDRSVVGGGGGSAWYLQHRQRRYPGDEKNHRQHLCLGHCLVLERPAQSTAHREYGLKGAAIGTFASESLFAFLASSEPPAD